MKTLLSVAKSAFHENLPPADAERLHEAAVEAVRRRRRFRLRMRILQVSTAACLLVSVGLLLRPHRDVAPPATGDAGQDTDISTLHVAVGSPRENAMDILLYDEYGEFFGDDAGDASKRLLLLQEYPGNL